MKRLKNNKGVTGIDIAVSVSIIAITLGIVMAIYTAYSNKSKEIKRNSVATNLAMTVIETIETTDINNPLITDITTDESGLDLTASNCTNYGINSNLLNAYSINVKKIRGTESILDMVAFQIDVIVSYRIEDEIKTVTLSTIKKYDNTGEAEKPDMNSATIAGCVPIKYDTDKDEYIQTNTKDSNWYSISSRKFPMVAKLKTGEKTGVEGIIKLSQCDKVYVWIPSYGRDSSNIYRYCDSSGKIIKYVTESTISSYKVTNVPVTTGTQSGGIWVEQNSTEHNNIKNKIFSWN